MASGYITTGTLADGLQVMVAEARAVADFKGVMTRLVDVQNLEDGTGLDWREISLGRVTASAIGESELFDNPQQVDDTAFTVTPTVIGVMTVITDRVQKRLASKAYVKLGGVASNAIVRKTDVDGLTVLDGFTSLGGAGTTLHSGIVTAGKARISSNATEHCEGPYYTVLHGFQLKDLQDELLSSVGTYPVDGGVTAETYREGFAGRIGGTEVYEDGNITIDSSDDAKGGVFAKKAIVLVYGRKRWEEHERKQIGGGANAVFLYSEYAYGERLAGGSTSSWGFEIYSDATSPTS